MDTPNKKELSDLYPKPKTYEQLEAERERIQQARKPKFVALKLATWSATFVFIALATYGAVTLIMNSHLSSAGAVIAGTSFSFLVCLVGMAAAFYLYTLIKSLLTKVSLSGAALFTALLVVFVLSGLLMQLLVHYRTDILLSAAATLSFDFLAAYFVLGLLLKAGHAL